MIGKLETAIEGALGNAAIKKLVFGRFRFSGFLALYGEKMLTHFDGQFIFDRNNRPLPW